VIQLEAIVSRPIATYLGEETNTCLTTNSSTSLLMTQNWEEWCIHQKAVLPFSET